MLILLLVLIDQLVGDFASHGAAADHDDLLAGIDREVLLEILFSGDGLVETLIGLFSQEPDVIRAGAGMSRFLAPLYLILCIRELLAGYLRGYGRSRQPMLLSIIGMIGARQLFLALATRRWSSVTVIYSAYPVGWTAAMLLLLAYTLLTARQMWAEAENEPRGRE